MAAWHFYWCFCQSHKGVLQGQKIHHYGFLGGLCGSHHGVHYCNERAGAARASGTTHLRRSGIAALHFVRAMVRIGMHTMGFGATQPHPIKTPFLGVGAAHELRERAIRGVGTAHDTHCAGLSDKSALQSTQVRLAIHTNLLSCQTSPQFPHV